MRTEFNLNDFNMIVQQRDNLKDEVKKLKRKNGILATLLVTSIIIAGDIATQLHHTQRALEMEQQRVEVLEVQAHDTSVILEVHDNWFFEYIETGYIKDLQQSVDRYMESGTQQKIEETKGSEL